MAAGRLPGPRESMLGHFRWHLDEVQLRLAQLYDLPDHTVRREASRRLAEDAITALTAAMPPVRQRGDRPATARPVLSPGRQKHPVDRTRKLRGIPV